RHPHVPSAQDLERNRLFAQLAALALEHDRLLGDARRRLEENQRLYAAEQEARRVAEAAAARVSVLADASLLLDASLDVEATLDGVVRLVTPRLADHACIRAADSRAGTTPLASADVRSADGETTLEP